MLAMSVRTDKYRWVTVCKPTNNNDHASTDDEHDTDRDEDLHHAFSFGLSEADTSTPVVARISASTRLTTAGYPATNDASVTATRGSIGTHEADGGRMTAESHAPGRLLDDAGCSSTTVSSH